jgi:hypothetical protein
VVRPVLSQRQFGSGQSVSLATVFQKSAKVSRTSAWDYSELVSMNYAGQTSFMGPTLFTDLIGARGKWAGWLMAMVNLPKAEREVRLCHLK